MSPLSEHAVRTILSMLDVREARVVHLHTEDAATYARRAGYRVTERAEGDQTVYDVRRRPE